MTDAFSLSREERRRVWRELRGAAPTPGRAAATVALGLFIGALPMVWTHLPLVLALCIPLRLDAPIALVASGAALLASRALAGPSLQGTVLAGTLLAAVGAAAAAMLSRLAGARERAPYRLPESAPPWVSAVERVATRFASPTSPAAMERATFHYVRTKLLGDPVAKLVADVEGASPGALGELLDVGTGRGQLPLLLLELGRARAVRGVDWDDHKIVAAQRAAQEVVETRATFTQGDVRTAPLAPADTVLLIDVLHYFKEAEQDAILDRAAAAVRPGGRLLVREADTKRGWRTLATLAEERFFTLVRFNRGERVRFRPAAEIAARMGASGLRAIVQPAWGRTPFSNVLVVGRRPLAVEL